MSLDTLVEDPDDAARAREAIIASWTGDAPEPACWLETSGFKQSRHEIIEALRGASPVVLTGPDGHGKSLLLRSFWQQPPNGFAPILVPFSDVEPAQIAASILSTTRMGPVHDAENALKRLLVTQDRRRARPVLLIDELQSMPPATLLHLLALASAANVEVELVAAGVESTPLHELARLLPRTPRWIAIDAPWTRADAERLVVRIAAALQIDVVAVLRAIDVDEVISGSDGKPRLVRTAIAAQLRRLDLSCLDIASVTEPPVEVPPVEASVAIPDPVALEPEITMEPEPAPEPEPALFAIPSPPPAPPPPLRAPVAPHVYVPRTALVAASSASPPPLLRSPAPRSGRSRARRQRRFSVARVGVSLSAAIAACAAIALAVDRGPALLASMSAIASVLGADPLELAGAWAQRELDTARRAWEVAEPVVVAAADPPIPVSVNSDPWSNVQIDGVGAGATPLTIDLAPGPHEFRAELADGRVIEQVVHVSHELDHISFR